MQLRAIRAQAYEKSCPFLCRYQAHFYVFLMKVFSRWPEGNCENAQSSSDTEKRGQEPVPLPFLTVAPARKRQIDMHIRISGYKSPNKTSVLSFF